MDNQKVIGERTFSVSKMPATESVGVQLALAKMIGPAFGSLVDAQQAGGGDASNAEHAAGAAIIAALAEHLDEGATLRIAATVFRYVNVDGKKYVGIDDMFADRPPTEFWEALVFALTVNYRDFFQGDLIKNLMGKFSPKLKASNPSHSKT